MPTAIPEWGSAGSSALAVDAAIGEVESQHGCFNLCTSTCETAWMRTGCEGLQVSAVSQPVVAKSLRIRLHPPVRKDTSPPSAVVRSLWITGRGFSRFCAILNLRFTWRLANALRLSHVLQPKIWPAHLEAQARKHVSCARIASKWIPAWRMCSRDLSLAAIVSPLCQRPRSGCLTELPSLRYGLDLLTCEAEALRRLQFWLEAYVSK